MSIKMVVQGVEGITPIQNFSDPVEAESVYLRICATVRTDGPGAVKISTHLPGMPDAYFRLDRDWDGPREQHIYRISLWTETSEGYSVPSPWQLRGAAHALGMSGEGIAQALGITGRQWRYYLAGERQMPFAEWRCIRVWLEQISH